MNNSLEVDISKVTGKIKMIDKEKYENENTINFNDKISMTFWSIKLQVTKAQLHNAAKNINSNAVNDIAAYLENKFA